ncbi:MAG: beta-N-acetylhexosaminidase [Bacteroidaceae bacterium]|nr:beta-N-acetylhexosaminidase [Bacteroidaceae bacterium]
MKKLTLILCGLLLGLMARADALPTPSTEGNESWYQIRFVSSGGILTTNGTGICRTQRDANTDTQWFKFLRQSDNTYTIISRAGLTLYANTVSKDGKIYAASAPTGTSAFSIVAVATGFEIRPAGQSAIAMNQFGGSALGNNIGLWDTDDTGNAVSFVSETDYAELEAYNEAQVKLPLIPFPQEVKLLGDTLRINLQQVLADVQTVVQTDTVQATMGTLHFVHDASLQPAAYRLQIHAEQGILVSASTQLGFIYALQTLRQVALLADVSQSAGLPCLSITDAPRFEHRGLMLDFSRHWFPKAEVLKIIDAMALYKMSRLHMHLSDDQGWRIEIPEYPLLTTKGAIRAGSLTNKGTDPHFFDDTPYGEGCFFTLDDLREIVDYALKRGIVCYPEIDLPGHMVAAITAYPSFSCDETRAYEVRIDEGISTTPLNVAKPEVISFLKTVLGYMAEIFPSDYIHIGGDECPTSDWQALVNKGDALFTQFMSDNQLTNVNQVQPWLVNELGTWLKATYNKDVVVWDELAENWDSRYQFKPIVMAWRSLGYTQTAGQLGFRSIATPIYPNYWDQMQCTTSQADLCEVYQGGYGDNSVNTVESVYNLNPTSSAGAYSDMVLGTQANLWAEAIADNDELEYQIFPRALALSEVGWTAQEHRNFDQFRARLQYHAPLLERLGLTFAKHYIEAPRTTVAQRNLAAAQQYLSEGHPGKAGYPSVEAYDALRQAVDEGKVSTTQLNTFKNAALTMPEPGRVYRILSAATYYKTKYIGSSAYLSGNGLRFHYTQQIEPEELFRFEQDADGNLHLCTVVGTRGIQISAAGATVIDGMGSVVKIARSTKSSTGGNGTAYTYVHGAVTIKTGSYGLYAQPSGNIGTESSLSVCYPGTWYLEEVTDFTAETEGLVRRASKWLAQDAGEDGQPTDEALALLRNEVYTPAQQALATGYVSETTYNALVEAYNAFLAIPLKSYSEEIDERYFYYIKNVWHGGYAVANLSTQKVSAGSRNATTALWAVFRHADGTVSIHPKQDLSLYVVPASITSAAELHLGTKATRWTLRRGATAEASGVTILEPSSVYSWYSNGSGTQILRPRDWGAAFWQFERSDVLTAIRPPLITTSSAALYDLQGRRVERPAQGGVYIRNGQKVAM